MRRARPRFLLNLSLHEARQKQRYSPQGRIKRSKNLIMEAAKYCRLFLFLGRSWKARGDLLPQRMKDD